MFSLSRKKIYEGRILLGWMVIVIALGSAFWRNRMDESQNPVYKKNSNGSLSLSEEREVRVTFNSWIIYQGLHRAWLTEIELVGVAIPSKATPSFYILLKVIICRNMIEVYLGSRSTMSIV